MYTIPINSPVIVFHSKEISFNSQTDRMPLFKKAEKVTIKTSRQLSFMFEEYCKNSHAWFQLRTVLIHHMNIGIHFQFSLNLFRVFKRVDKEGEWLLLAPEKFIIEL